MHCFVDLFEIIHWPIFFPFLVLQIGIVNKMPIYFLFLLGLWLLLHLWWLWEFDVPLLFLFQLFLHLGFCILLSHMFGGWFCFESFTKSWELFFVCGLLEHWPALAGKTFALFILVWVLVPALGGEITWLHWLLWLACLQALSLPETNFIITIMTPEANVQLCFSQLLMNNHVVFT